MKKFENLFLRVRAIIVNNDSVLCIKQGNSQNPTLTIPGGGVEIGESLIDALYREVEEEVKIEIDNPLLKGVRETQIKYYYKSIEYFFVCNFKSGIPILERGIHSYEWIPIKNLKNSQLKPEFLYELFEKNNSIRYFYENLTLYSFYLKYEGIPKGIGLNELVYVMLKPDCLENNLQDSVINDLIDLGGILLARASLTLKKEQVELIYSDFNFDPQRDLVFDYLANNETIHLVFVGSQGIHTVFNEAKGKTGDKVGLRAKYIKDFTKLNHTEFQNWLNCKHPNQDKITLEMFCCNLLHEAPDSSSSLKVIKSIFESLKQNL